MADEPEIYIACVVGRTWYTYIYPGGSFERPVKARGR